MKRFLLLVFFPLVVFGQASNTGSSIGGSGSAAIPRNPAVFDADVIHAGSDIYVDIRAYGAYATFSTSTCKTTNGSPGVRLGAAANFKNGEYATCYNAGPAATAATPSAPTVTPSDHAGGMSVVNDRGGSSFYAYEVVAEDKNNGRSAASPAGSTSTGTARLGQTTQFNVSGCTRSNQTVTCTTTAAHPFVAGQLVILNNMADNSFNGNWITVSPTRGTTVTFLSGWDTRNGASTSTIASLNPNVWGFKLNRVSYATQANAFRYHIYGPKCPATCNWMGQSVLPYWDDYGPTMGGSQTRPAWIPASAPSSGANQHFTFRINSGAGTTLLMANSDAAITGSNTIVSDDGPAIVAAAAAAGPSIGTASCVVIPNGYPSPQINSYTDVSAYFTCIEINGTTLTVNNTLAGPYKIWGVGGGTNLGFFGHESLSSISGSGFPMIYGTAGGRPSIRDLNIATTAPNGGLGVYQVNPSTMTWRDVYLSAGAGSTNDCTNMQVLIQNTRGGNGFTLNFQNITGITGTCPNGSPVPTFVDLSTDTGSGSSVSISNGWFLNRTSFDNDLSGICGAGFYVGMNNISMQNSTEPALQISGTCSSALGGNLNVDLGEADFATPLIGIYTYGGQKWAGTIAGNPGIPNGGGNSITGTPVANILVSEVPPTSVGSNRDLVNLTTGTIVDGSYNGSAETIINEDVSLGTGYTLFSKDLAGGAPTCSVAASGPPFTQAGTYFFSYAAQYANGGLGTLSFPSASSCTANGTTQQIRVSIPSSISGATGYIFYRNSSSTSGGFQFQTASSGCGAATRLSVVMQGASCGPPSPSLAGGGPAGIRNGNIWAQDIFLGPALAPTGSVNSTQFYMDSMLNWPSFKPNGNRPYLVPGISGPVVKGHNLCADGSSGGYVDCLTTQTIASGTAALGTSAIAAKTCAAVVTTAATGVVTTDAISYSFNGAPSGAYTAGLFVQSYVTLGNVNFLVCNPSH